MRPPNHATPGVLLLILAIVLPVLYYIWLARRKKDLYVRRLAGVDAIDEACGRSAELGRPMAFTTGLTAVGPILYACLGVVYYVARKAAMYKSKFFYPQNDPEVLPIAEDIVREAYKAEGKVAAFDPGSVSYLSNEQFAFAAGYMGLVQREEIASAFLMGRFAAESLLLAEAGQQMGAMQIAASVSPEQVAFFICTCDYTLIGEELYAASAYLTREPVQLGSLYGQDRTKLLFFVIIIIGVAIATLHSLYPDAALFQSNVDSWIVMEYGEWAKLLGFSGEGS